MFLCPVYRLGLVFPGGRWRCDPRSCWAAISPGDGWALTHPGMAMGYLGCRWDGGVKALKMEVSTRTMEGFVGMISPIARWFFCRFSPSEDLIYCLLLKFPHYSTWIIQSAVFPKIREVSGSIHNHQFLISFWLGNLHQSSVDITSDRVIMNRDSLIKQSPLFFSDRTREFSGDIWKLQPSLEGHKIRPRRHRGATLQGFAQWLQPFGMFKMSFIGMGYHLQFTIYWDVKGDLFMVRWIAGDLTWDILRPTDNATRF